MPTAKKTRKTTTRSKRTSTKLEPKVEKPSQAETLKKYRKGYAKAKSALGNSSAHNNDPVAKALEGKSPGEVVAMAETLLKFKKGELAEKYAALNPGAQRMNAGNRLRAAWKRGDLKEEALA